MDGHGPWMAHDEHAAIHPLTLKCPAGAKLRPTLEEIGAHGRDTLIDVWPEGPPDKNVGMVEALGKAWSWRMPPQKWMSSTTTTSHQPERH